MKWTEAIGKQFRWENSKELHKVTSAKRHGGVIIVYTFCEGTTTERAFMLAAEINEQLWHLVGHRGNKTNQERVEDTDAHIKNGTKANTAEESASEEGTDENTEENPDKTNVDLV